MITMKWRSRRVIQGLEKMDVKENDKILDVGCGDMYISNIIKDHFNCEIDGVDKGDVIPDKEYDKALLICSIHHMSLPVQVKMLKKALSAAKEVIVFDSEPSLWVEFLDQLMAKVHPEPAPSSHRTIEECEYIASLCGAKITDMHKLKRTGLFPHNYIIFKMVKNKPQSS